MEGEGFVHATQQAGDKMVSECAAYRTFGGISTVLLGGNELEVHCFVAEKTFQRLRAFIVEALKLGTQPGGDQPCVDALEQGC